MNRKRITLADGRYLIFYSFDDESANEAPHAPIKTVVEREEGNAQPEALEERDV